MTKQAFYRTCPKTRKEFVTKYNTDKVFRNWAQVFGFAVLGDNVMLPNGMVANAKVR